MIEELCPVAETMGVNYTVVEEEIQSSYPGMVSSVFRVMEINNLLVCEHTGNEPTFLMAWVGFEENSVRFEYGGLEIPKGFTSDAHLLEGVLNRGPYPSHVCTDMVDINIGTILSFWDGRVLLPSCGRTTSVCLSCKTRANVSSRTSVYIAGMEVFISSDCKSDKICICDRCHQDGFRVNVIEREGRLLINKFLSPGQKVA